MTNGRNGTHAYLKVHPKATAVTARAEAVRVLTKPSVKEHIERLVRAAIPDTIESIRADLELAHSLAVAAKDYALIASIGMDRAKLAGLLVEKREIKSVSDEEKKVVRDIVQSALTPIMSYNADSVKPAPSN